MIRPSLEQASTIIEASFAKGLELNAKPLTVAILDQGGQLKALKRQDGSSLLRPEIAMGKAWGALGMGQNSRQLGEVAAERPSFIAAAV
ncbi:MAG: heme-binding protein, partial [Alphaproteobacteria bacterium]|nr:heme-binding protein [Alphaproteobacteria bacterium]